MKKLYYFFLSAVFLLLILSVASAYYKFKVAEDYVVKSQVECDPAVESCFVWRCDPEITGDCTGNADEDVSYYKLAHRNVQNISCNGENECDFTCEAGELDCGEELCSEQNEDGVECYTETSMQVE